ncbi:MAG: hypothetical protein CMP38_03470 [Rickettsiales bacterium]|nr:hypothetical protein [Rickettsiales bacterium]OUW03790.1 MAG: hypothetical protein CBD16_02995 [Betaproteobacteria bacterium TMED156]|tara:strand:- start:1020 stop:1823 length:804 start_codon:yes stop_codon:yes gene_type:complete
MKRIFASKSKVFIILIFFPIYFFSSESIAFLEDEEARRAILQIREKLNTIEKKLEKNTNQLNEQIQSSKQGRLKLVNDIEQLNSELARFRGFGEETQQYNEIFTDKLKMLEETMDTIKSRISSLEPQAVIVSGREILVGNFEKQMYEEASEMMASGNYSAAIQLFEKFNKKYKESSLTAYALHAKGLAYYAVQAHNSAIVTLRSIEKDHLNYPKLPDAMLTLSASQTEAGKIKDAIKTLQSLIKRAPSSDAALTARERIKQLTPEKL